MQIGSIYPAMFSFVSLSIVKYSFAFYQIEKKEKSALSSLSYNWKMRWHTSDDIQSN